ncbi:MAG: PorT family protein [Lewinellaceae bacterium]|nr:PorT family protein [Lewinellaceae bacterium]MCB9330002.1 PorT family protein [Lewinellaceae bacterium]
MQMLKNLLFTLVFGLFFTAANAQVQASIGPRAGINLANWSASQEITDDFGTSPKNRVSLLFGAVAEIRFSNNIALQPEINFIQKGMKLVQEYDDPNLGTVRSKGEIIINNLEIPILIKAGTSFGSGRFDVLAGPSWAYGLNGKTKYTETINGNSESGSQDINFEDDGVTRSEFSLQFGAMFSYNLGAANLFLDARYILGFSNLVADAIGSESAKNRGIAFSVGALFPM